ERERVGALRVVDGDEAPEDVGVATQVLGRRMDDGVGTELEGPLEERGGERVVDHAPRVSLVGEGGHGRDVGDGEHRVGGRLDPDQTRLVAPRAVERAGIGEIGGREREPGILVHARQAVGAAVRVGGRAVSPGAPLPTVGRGGAITSATGRSSTDGSRKARSMSARSCTEPTTSAMARGSSALSTGTCETSYSRRTSITPRTGSSGWTWTSTGRSAALRWRTSPAVWPPARRKPKSAIHSSL